jgi:hypothetical protein
LRILTDEEMMKGWCEGCVNEMPSIGECCLEGRCGEYNATFEMSQSVANSQSALIRSDIEKIIKDYDNEDKIDVHTKYGRLLVERAIKAYLQEKS